MPPKYLYKILSLEAWEKSQKQPNLILPPMDDAFIHLAKEDQVHAILSKFWTNQPHIVLKLRTESLPGRLVYETNPGGTTKYYHLYEGHLPLTAVIDSVS
ncbi:MAG: hypothetical protein S4CHLAM102_08800 [Chlamydiia bacterium]|nr:hypothetical protein [Chlamydiia bacterium]